jgi:predicted TIM-barrel fold metal-dependent hydrolase
MHPMTSTTIRDVPFPPDPNPRKPRLVAPPGSWDTHFHIYGPPDRFPYAENRGFTPPAAPIEHWQSVSAAIGIERGVVVTPGIHGSNPAATLDAIARSGGRLRGMIRADPALTANDVEALHAGGIRGVRFPFAKELGRDFDVNVVRTSVPQLAARRWITAFQIDDDMIERYADIIAGIPLPTVIDGFAGLSPGRGLDQPAFRTLLDVLAKPHVHLKLFVADRNLRNGERYEDIVAMSRAAIAKAPDRIIWGSDWPHSYIYKAGDMPNDGDLIDMLLDFAPDEGVRKKILVDNPTRLFDFD